MTIENQSVRDRTTGRARRLAERAALGKSDLYPSTAVPKAKATKGGAPRTTHVRPSWTRADEETVLRLAEGVRLAASGGSLDVSELSDEEFLKQLAR